MFQAPVSASLAGAMAVALCAGSAAGRLEAPRSALAPAPERVELLATDVAVLDVDAGRLLTGRDIVVRGTRIERMVPSGGVRPAAKVHIDGRGKVLIPGLILPHVRVGRVLPAGGQAWLSWGVTGVGDAGTARSQLDAWRADLSRGRLYAPRIWSSCASDPEPWARAAAADGVHAAMARLVAEGQSPVHALRRFTIDAARAVCAPNAGVVRVGESADFVVLQGNPLEDIRHTRAIDAVVFRGETLTHAHVQLLRRGALPLPTPPAR